MQSSRLVADIEPIALEPVDALTITTLVDNLTDILLVDVRAHRPDPLGAPCDIAYSSRPRSPRARSRSQ